MTKSAYARNKPKHSLCGKCDRYRSYCEYLCGVKRTKRTRCPEFKHSRKYIHNKVKEKKEDNRK